MLDSARLLFYMHLLVYVEERGGPIFAMADGEVMFKNSNMNSNPPVTVNGDVTSSTRVRRYFPETWIWLSDSVG